MLTERMLALTCEKIANDPAVRAHTLEVSRLLQSRGLTIGQVANVLIYLQAHNVAAFMRSQYGPTTTRLDDDTRGRLLHVTDEAAAVVSILAAALLTAMAQVVDA